MTNATNATPARIARAYAHAERRAARRLDQLEGLRLTQRAAYVATYREAWWLAARLFDALVTATGSRVAAGIAACAARHERSA